MEIIIISIIYLIVSLSLMGLIVYLFKESNKQILILTKALSAKNFNDVLVATKEPEKHIKDEIPMDEPVALSDLSDEEANKIIQKQLELKSKK